MAITYHAGRRIQGLSTDITNTPTFEDDYSNSTGWTEVGTTTNITGGVWTSNSAGNNADHGFYKALGFTLDNEKWYCEFDIKQTGSGDILESGVPLFFSTGTAKPLDGSHSALGIMATNGGAVELWANTAGTSSTTTGQTAFVYGTQYYGVLIRTSATNLQLKYYTDSARTQQYGSTTNKTISSAITGLTTIQHRTTDNGGTSSGASNIIDNVKVYNGVTSLTNKPTNVQSGSRFEETDTRKIYYALLPSVTFEDDFSSDNWTDVTTKIQVTGGVLSATIDRRDVNDGSYYDLGSTISDSAWVLRCKMTINTVTQSNTPVYRMYFGIASVDGTSVFDNAGVTFDWVGLNARISNTWAEWNADYFDSSGGLDANKQAFAHGLTTETLYVEIIRTSTTQVTMEFFSDSGFSSSIEIETLSIPSTVQNLRYLRCSNGYVSGGGSGANTLQIDIDDIEFYNGVTSTDFTWTEEV